MPIFFIKKEQIANDRIHITNEDAVHINVLRHQAGDEIVVADGLGFCYDCIIESIVDKEIHLRIAEKRPSDSEPMVKISVFQGLPKNDKMELIIQKCVELGAFEIVPVITEHTVVKLNDKSSRKTERLQKISESAAKQCERGVIPVIHQPVTFLEAVEMLKDLEEAYVAYEREEKNKAVDFFMRSKGERIGLFIGPEGGFSKTEIEYCIRNNVSPISLGRRILRTETAGFVAIITLLLFREELQVGKNTSVFS